jgi:hypothetical protein
MSYTGDDLAGVGGWLAFFVISMAFLSPLAMVVANAADLYGDPAVALAYGSVWGSVQLAIWTPVAVGIAICWFISYRLMRVERWSTVRLTIAAIWLLALGLNAVQLLLLSAVAQIPLGELMGPGSAEFGRGTVSAIIWTSYFLLSKRVANTYRRNADSEELAERFA